MTFYWPETFYVAIGLFILIYIGNKTGLFGDNDD